jgi:hypothetical protein
LLGRVIPEQVAQPALRHRGEVEPAGAAGETDPEVLGLDVAGVLRVGRAVVDQLKFLDDLLDHPSNVVFPVLLAVRDVDVKQRLEPPLMAEFEHGLNPGQLPDSALRTLPMSV